jgi:hypothetical protein
MDQRVKHYSAGPSLLNQPNPEFRGAARSLYGDRGPQRPMQDYNRKLSGPPESIADHIDQTLDRVKGLGPKQRLAVHNEMVKLSRDISYIRMVASQAHHMGPHSEAATHLDSQGNVITG